MQTHANFGGIFGCFLQGHNLHRNMDDALSAEGCRGCSFLKTSHAKNITFYRLTNAKHYSGQTCFLHCNSGSLDCWSVVFTISSSRWALCMFVCVHTVHAYICTFKCVRSHKQESVNVHAEAQRYSFGHRYELCIEQTEILKIYFFLSANYSV